MGTSGLDVRPRSYAKTGATATPWYSRGTIAAVLSRAVKEKGDFLSALLHGNVALMPSQIVCVGLCNTLRLHIHIVIMLSRP